MSKYQDWLIDHIREHPDFIRPERYSNEVLSFLNGPLEDLCISRPKSRLSWGIDLPFDDRYVTYVWFDALINYVSALEYPDGTLFNRYWPVAQHLIAKDILKPHGIYWPTMLKAASIPLYQHLNVHGYWNVDEKKMSKSKGTVVKPLDLLEIYGLDAFRYFLLREMVFGLDANFSEEALIGRINADLANDLGNLISRLLAMVNKYCDGKVPKPDTEKPDDKGLKQAALQLPSTYADHMQQLQFHKALMEIWEVINHVNRYVDQSAPWVLARDPQQQPQLHTVLYYSLETLKIVAVLLMPIMPDASTEVLDRLGLELDPMKLRLDHHAAWGTLQPETQTRRGKSLFPRIERKVEVAEEDVNSKKPIVKLDEFSRLDLRVAEIVKAESVPDSENLLKLEIDLGEKRTVVASIATSYRTEDLVGRQVVVVANLKPTTLMGIRSEAMVLVASVDGQMALIAPEKKVKPGSPVH